MKKLLLVTTTIIIIIGFSGCADNRKVYQVSGTSMIDKTFEMYKTHKNNKAMAVAIDDYNRYAIGYSSDYSSQNEANKRAIKECINANNALVNKVNAECKIYAINNDIVRDLDSK